MNPQPKSLIVACEAVVNGSQAGVAEANKRSTGDEEFKQVLRTAGEMLMNVRKYSLAADLLQAGASGDNAARTMGLASMLRSAKLHEDLHFGSDPRDVAMEFFLLSIDPSLTVEKLNAHISKNAQTVFKNMDPEEIDAVLKVGTQMRRSLARSGASPMSPLTSLWNRLSQKAMVAMHWDIAKSCKCPAARR